jgi:nitrate/nitrite-specific signal transduction histidine kinase
MSDERRPNLFARGEEFLTLFRRGAEFTKELLRENERLRHQLVEHEQEQQTAARTPEDWGKLRIELAQKLRSLEEECASYRERLLQVEEENRQFVERYLEIEEENNNLANLYVASYQLHSTLDLDEVLKIIIEIVINLIGGQTFAVYVHDEKTGLLEAVASEGEDVAVFPSMPLGEGVVGSAVATGATSCSGELVSSDFSRPIVAIPLRVNDRPIGAIAIFDLLVQKDGLSPLDHELFTLLAGHAATAIFAAQLHSQSERKLSTIQGFIDLLTK